MSETLESGPISTGIWDTRTRENSRYCEYCQRWLSLSAFAWVGDKDTALLYHQKEYCRMAPNFHGAD